MTTQQAPLEILGQSIAQWDQFYESNYFWIHQASLDFCQNEKIALILTNKIFLKILLHSPECVVKNNPDHVLQEIEFLFPSLKASLNKSTMLDALKLMKVFYNDN